MSRQAWRYQTLPQNTAKIKKFCQKYSFSVKELNNGYQLRIEDVLDLYPVRAKYHNLTTHERGEWETMDDLRKIMLKALPQFDKQIGYNPDMKAHTDGITTIKEPDFYGLTIFRVSRNPIHKLYLKIKYRNNPRVKIIPISTLKTSYELKPDIGKSLPKDDHNEPL